MSSVSVKPCVAAQSATDRPPPFRIVTSSESMRTCSRTSTLAPAARGAAAWSSANRTGGATSCWRRWSVQSPPRSTFDGSAGSGMIDPNDVWSLENSKLVM